jgi:ABC-2 type transport system permease protein
VMDETPDIRDSRTRDWMHFSSVIVTILLIASLSTLLRVRIDLTEEKRYTLSEPTLEILSSFDGDIYIQVYLDGDIPIPFKRLKRSVREMLDEFRIASDRRIDFEFINPSAENEDIQREEYYSYLASKGLSSVNIRAGDSEGGSSQKIVFPGMIINYNGIEVPVNFLRNNPYNSAEQNILHSVEGLEYEMIQTIATVTSDTVYKVAFVEGHDEISEIETADITYNLAKYFTVDRGIIGGEPGILDDYAAVIIAGPESEFDEADKLVLDQYIMGGGKVMWLIDEVSVDDDSLVYGETVGLYRPLNIEDQLFRYGARVNPSVVQDLDCILIPLTIMSGGTRQQIVPAPWVYYPLLRPAGDHPITKNINRVKGEFINYIDTVGLDGNIKKKILLTTSEYSRAISPPMVIRLEEAESLYDEDDFSLSYLPVAVLLEGIFPSAFRNRMIPARLKEKLEEIKTESSETKIIVIADADIIRNEVSRLGVEETPSPLGRDRYTGELYGNSDFLINCLNYLVDENSIMELRSREMKLRLLDQDKIKGKKLKWQLINVAGPLLIVVIAGIVYNFFRRRRYITG